MASIRFDRARASGTPLPGLRVLVVEDEEAARVATRRYLQHCGYDVAAAASFSEAIAKARYLQPDVLVCDWKLSGRRDGVDVARAVQELCGSAVIFMTAHALTDLRRNLRGIDAADCLRKPISLTALAAVVATVGAASSAYPA